MHSAKQWLGWGMLLLASVVVVQVAASNFQEEQASDAVWAFLNWFMAVSVVSAVAVSYLRWRGATATGADTRNASAVLLAASVLLLLLFFEQWRFTAGLRADGEVPQGLRLQLWLAVDLLFVLINAVVGMYLLREFRVAR